MPVDGFAHDHRALESLRPFVEPLRLPGRQQVPPDSRIDPGAPGHLANHPLAEPRLLHPLSNAQLRKNVRSVFEEGLRWADEQGGPWSGPFPFGNVVERGQQVGNAVEPDPAFPAAGCSLDHQHPVAGVGDALVLVGLDGLDDNLQLPIVNTGLAQGRGQRPVL